jgi:hypothetical protein
MHNWLGASLTVGEGFSISPGSPQASGRGPPKGCDVFVPKNVLPESHNATLQKGASLPDLDGGSQLWIFDIFSCPTGGRAIPALDSQG